MSDVRRFSQNFGHPSGIPRDWDGRVYGLPVDPIAVIISIGTILIGRQPISPIYRAGRPTVRYVLLNVFAKFLWPVGAGSMPTVL